MKKLLPFILTIIACLMLTSCGSTSVKGDLKSYSNGDKSFSIDLPTANDKFWVINEESPSSILDISDVDDTLNIRVQCVSKLQVQSVASDLNGYKDYALMNTLGDILADSELKESQAEVPDFITESLVYDFKLSSKVKGKVLFMESQKCYYTYYVMAVDKAYSGNEKAFDESILSLKELNNAQSEK